MAGRIQVYELYPIGGDEFSNKRVDYYQNGKRIVWVAAVSSKQAHRLAGQRTWAEDREHPKGILAERIGEWAGPTPFLPKHGDGITAIQEWWDHTHHGSDAPTTP